MVTVPWYPQKRTAVAPIVTIVLLVHIIVFLERGADDASDPPPAVKRRRLEPIIRTPPVLVRMAASARGAAQMREAVRNREKRVRAARPQAKANPRAQPVAFNAVFSAALVTVYGLYHVTKHIPSGSGM